ncbi:hypothetical protein P154DRAFT_570320 [Amniculicola lignicola CBS 123094]|uniref:Uncharacterized protein n=1 Tax=Amniculicola lignicola CBS 123094 TaxID=1392246 RepID=A0A6A5X200_9PLEO|nr:hypothetical protein P154DRAFT_570320 [Amniculicola lignicola CBS 123094]
MPTAPIGLKTQKPSIGPRTLDIAETTDILVSLIKNLRQKSGPSGSSKPRRELESYTDIESGRNAMSNVSVSRLIHAPALSCAPSQKCGCGTNARLANPRSIRGPGSRLKERLHGAGAQSRITHFLFSNGPAIP